MTPTQWRCLFGVLALWLAACGDNNQTNNLPTPEDASTDLVADEVRDLPKDDGADQPDASEPLEANAGENQQVDVGQEITLDGAGSTGAALYQWDFGNGQGWEQPRPEAQATVTYAQTGRYKAVLRVFDAQGRERTDAVRLTVTHPPSHVPQTSSSVQFAVEAGALIGAALSEDAGAITRFAVVDGAFTQVERVRVCARPMHLARAGQAWAITCKGDDTVVVLPDASQTPRVLTLPYGASPHGILAVGDTLHVTLQGKGQLLTIDLNTDARRSVDVVPDARGISRLPDGRLAITRWRSFDGEGALAVVDPETQEVTSWRLPLDLRAPSDTEHGGVPNYLEAAVVSPQGDQIVVPSLQANTLHGTFLNGEAFSHDIALRAVLSFVDPATGASEAQSRYHFDSRGLASAAVYSPRGEDLYVAMRGMQTVERLDMINGGESGTIFSTGVAPQGLAMSPDGRYLLVEASLSRQVSLYDLRASAQPTLADRISLVDTEPLDPQVLQGKQLFNTSFDLRLTQEGYIACAHCHLDGQSDGLVWDFTDRGEGLRNTTTMLGRAGDAHGPIHWSGNFDEIQDFEHDIREHFKGFGLMEDEDYEDASPLGAPKAGLSPELDALSAYADTLTDYPRSPHRAPDGALTQQATRGKALFESAQTQCTTCHTGTHLTDSAFVAPATPRLHDVGTLSQGSGNRLGQPLTGIDTPTLHGLHNGAPYLHDGRAATIVQVLTVHNQSDAHGTTSHLTPEQVEDLAAYLLSLDGRVD